MTAVAKPQSLAGALPTAIELSAAAVLDALERGKDKPLVFAYDGRDVRPGYHVTEVKTGTFRALDCGANRESWSETFIQLWDIDEADRSHMPARKFLAIIGKVRDAVGFDAAARLTFEVSDGVAPMRLYRAERVDAGDVVRVTLSPRPASCKPRDRWLQQEIAAKSAAACCASAAPCCG